MFIKLFKFNSNFRRKNYFLNFYRVEQKIFDFACNIKCAVVRFAREVESFLVTFAKNIIQQFYLLMKKDYKHLVTYKKLEGLLLVKHRNTINKKLSH